ncbi:MAG: phosphatase PAP2 family protein, partial [Gaiellaceae bacterium]
CTNLLALVGYVLMPTAPPRMFPEWGFVDTLATSASVNHGSGLIELASNPFAAMPSVHAADALIIGFALATLVRSRWLSALWTLWPTWVWFSVMATGNHFWLDVAAGIGIALVAGTMVAWAHNRRLATAPCLYCDRRW